MFETTFDRRALAEVYNILKLLEKSKFDKITTSWFRRK